MERDIYIRLGMLSNSIWIFIIAIAVVLILFLKHRPRANYNRVPKIIWSYWDNPDKIPKSVKLCMESWKKHNPDYKIVLMNKKNFKGFVTIPPFIASHYQFHHTDSGFSDLLRLYALAEHGGVWMDSTMLLKEPLDNWLFPRYGEFSGFYLDSFTKPGFPPVIESWFLACNKNSTFMKLWRDELIEIVNYPDVSKYIESRKQMGVDMQNINDPANLAIHVAAQKVLQLDKYPTDNFLFRKAEDGPYKYLVEAKWDSEKALHLACSDKKYQGPIMKIRGKERKVLEKEIDDDLSNAKCGWLD